MRRTRIFVPSTVFDNQELLRNAPEYLANLAMLPENERMALALRRWDSFDGRCSGNGAMIRHTTGIKGGRT